MVTWSKMALRILFYSTLIISFFLHSTVFCFKAKKSAKNTTEMVEKSNRYAPNLCYLLYTYIHIYLHTYVPTNLHLCIWIPTYIYVITNYLPNISLNNIPTYLCLCMYIVVKYDSSTIPIFRKKRNLKINLSQPISN